jgi:hypothetical protein
MVNELRLPIHARILTPGQIGELSVGKSVEIYYGMADTTGKHKTGAWYIKGGKTLEIK